MKIIHIKRIILYCLTFVIFSSCIIPVENRGPHVKQIDNYYLNSNNCRQIGMVQGSESLGNTMSHDKERAIQKAINEAADLGANSIKITNISQSVFTTEVDARAYKCKESKCSKKSWEDASKFNTIKSLRNFMEICFDQRNRYYKFAEQNLKIKLTEKTTTANEKIKKSSAQAVVLPIKVLGNINKTKIMIIFNKFLDEISNDYNLISQEEYEKAEETAFQELEYDECTEDQCIRLIQEILQVEKLYKMQLLKDGNDVQVSLTYIDLDKKLVKTDFCEGCNTSSLIKMVSNLYKALESKR